MTVDPRLEAAAMAYAASVSGAYNQSKNEWYRHAAAILGAADAASGTSVRATTAESAKALEDATTPDPHPRLPELRVEDGFGI